MRKAARICILAYMVAATLFLYACTAASDNDTGVENNITESMPIGNSANSSSGDALDNAADGIKIAEVFAMNPGFCFLTDTGVLFQHDSPDISAVDGNYIEQHAILTDVKDLVRSYGVNAAVTHGGDLYMWGAGEYGQLGNGSLDDADMPQKIMTNVDTVALNAWVTMCLTKNGEVWAWGANQCGQIGDGTTTDKTSPVKVLENVKAIAAGFSTSYAISNDNELYVWGLDTEPHNLADGWLEERGVVWPQKLLDDVQGIVPGTNALVLKTNGELWCFEYSQISALEGLRDKGYEVYCDDDSSGLRIGYSYKETEGWILVKVFDGAAQMTQVSFGIDVHLSISLILDNDGNAYVFGEYEPGGLKPPELIAQDVAMIGRSGFENLYYITNENDLYVVEYSIEEDNIVYDGARKVHENVKWFDGYRGVTFDNSVFVVD